MNYPLISEYVQAIKLSEENFDKLTNLRPVLDVDGNPIMSSGNFAVVFKMQDKQTGKLYAVKCFLREQEGREESYKLISSELEYLSSGFLVSVRYLEKELFVDTTQGNDTEFPVLIMDWVEGTTLDKYIRNNIHNRYNLSLVAYQFCRMASWLLSQEFAHGDLKPDNIIVREDGQLVLVDYDGMFVSAMKGQKARELGSVDYRHPLRNEDKFDSTIDYFSIASIALSLKAISLKPELLNEFGAEDRLLFSAKDYQNLGDSDCIKAINSLSNDVELAQLLGLFYIAYARNELAYVSFRLFNIVKPEYVPAFIPGVELSTEVTDEDLENAQNTYETAKAKVTELQSSVKETEISLSTAETNLGYTKITAPLDGTIVSVPVKEGQTVNAAMDTPAIVQIADLSQMEILIEISEGDISNIKPGVKVTYSILADLSDVEETTLKSIDPGLTLLTNNEYTEVVESSEAIYYYGRLVVPNTEGKLRIGMTTQNVIYVENAENVLTVPVTALKTEGTKKYVEILTPQGVQKRTVITGVSDGLHVEVKEGVNEGEEVILAYMSSAEISSKLSNTRRPRGF